MLNTFDTFYLRLVLGSSPAASGLSVSVATLNLLADNMRLSFFPLLITLLYYDIPSQIPGAQAVPYRLHRMTRDWRHVLHLDRVPSPAPLPKVHSLVSNRSLQPEPFQPYFQPHWPLQRRRDTAQPNLLSRKETGLRRRRRSLAEDDADVQADAVGAPELRAQISEHRVKLNRIKQQLKDNTHEKAFLEKTLELKKGQRTMQDGQVKLSQAELADKEKEIAMYKREAPRTLERYNHLVRKQRELQDTLNDLHKQSENLASSKKVIMDKIQNLNMEDIVERHVRALPDAMAGALRKSAAALTPFFDYLVIAADTNNRLVDQVGAEIDRYTHVNISNSPFMSGILFYCVLLIPLLTFFSFIRRMFDTSSKLTASHYIVLGNAYFLVMCVLNALIAQFAEEDPMAMLFRNYERSCILANLLLAFYYVWHVTMLSLQALLTLDRRNFSQLVATLAVGLHYFIFTWRNIFTDKPPYMFTCNYLIYATIFIFILHERYHRLTTRQLNDVPLFRFIHSKFNVNNEKTDRPESFGGMGSIFSSMWQTVNTPSRRFSRRHDRVLVTDKRNVRNKQEDRVLRTRSKPTYSSDSDTSLDIENTDDDIFPTPRRKASFGNTRNSKSRKDRSSRETKQPRGFMSVFFGGKGYGTDLSSEEDVQGRSTGWRAMRRVIGDAGRVNRPTSRTDRYSAKERKEQQPTRSLWKWP